LLGCVFAAKNWIVLAVVKNVSAQALEEIYDFLFIFHYKVTRQAKTRHARFE